MYHILIIEDDHGVALGLKIGFERENWQVTCAYTGKEGLEKFKKVEPDLIILDIGLPDISGFEVCGKICMESNVPIIFLTARDEEIDTILGLELGADDYVTKPVSIRQLCSRVKAVLRRVYGDFIGFSDKSNKLKFNGLEIDLLKRTVKRKNQTIKLTGKEFELLVTMAKLPGRVFTREMLLDRVWGFNNYEDDRVLNVSIYRLREKIELDPSNPQYIITVRGVGYKFNDEIK
ncbi:hypothetical protein BBF96_12135 [Anoxybacter fermentans]|uniref:Stage 0 sporulation protein A homolog n=1 Tax=Anoxybacter fermentans TaxID=1323375 RepID=A0A3Q9HS45_9FIRM|nr:response regulator transcription factor [Anoxybacter fermentans]AZR74079.1 hypothetical protein BBF96_12135 [Anoxybacter fermentans]